MLEFRTHHSIREIPEAAWDALGGPSEVPYLRWAFLEALEATGCVHPDKGWAPAHITLHEDGELVGAAPAYVKGNSEGEFVFDHSWAQFSYERLNHEYYPKLIVACPFTPATGPRLLAKPGTDVGRLTQGLAEGLRRFVDHVELSSAHVLFPQAQEAELLEARGLVCRVGIQYHWRNAGYKTFDDFLARYSSKRRNQIKRERRALVEQGVTLEVLTGADLTADHLDHAYRFYRATVDKYYWGRQYLNREFFQELRLRLPEQILLVLAKEQSSGDYVAGAFNLLGTQRLFGRYWGASCDLRHLHFNVCYYQGIEEAIRRGLEVFEPGAGGEHKVARGFEPTLTYSVHYLRHPQLNQAVRSHLRRERQLIEAQILEEPSLLKPA